MGEIFAECRRVLKTTNYDDYVHPQDPEAWEAPNPLTN